MRNLRILRKFVSGSPLPLPSSSVFCIGSSGYLFDVIGLEEAINGEDNCKHFLSNLVRVSEFGHIERMAKSNLLQDVFHVQFISDSGCLYLGTKRGQFLQFHPRVGDVEELFQAETGFAMFAVSPDSRLVAIVTRTGILQLLSLTTLELVIEQVIYDPTDHEMEMGKFSVNMSWRHDSQYFAVNMIDKVTGRRLKVYDESGTLFSSTEDSTQILSDVLCWQPSGGLIAAIERAPAGKDGSLISFFELNGLKRSSFNPCEAQASHDEDIIMSLSWNASSDILAIKKQKRVELWHRSNYLWMLKATIQHQTTESKLDEIKFFEWDREHSHRLYVVFQSGFYAFYDYCLTYSSGYSEGSALTVSINGSNLYCTPFSNNCAPPPYGFFQVSVESAVKEVVISSFWNGFLCILSTGKILLMKSSGQEMTAFKTLAVTDEVEAHTTYNWIWPNKRTICCISENRILVFEVPEDLYRIELDSLSSQLTQTHAIRMNCSSISVLQEEDSLESNNLLVRKHGGSILLLNLMNLENQPTVLFKVPSDALHDLKHLFIGRPSEENLANSTIIIGHDSFTRQLEIFLGGKPSAKLASDCTSTAIFDDYLLFTTVQGSLEIIHVSQLEKLLTASTNRTRTQVEQYSRKVEKGSVIVSCCWNRMLEPTVILQVLPRGNIETIHPRPLVVASIRKILCDEKKRSFHIIMGAMRRHRIDANVLVAELKRAESEGTSNLTMKGALESMVAEVKDPSVLVLFVTEINSENLETIRLLKTILQEHILRPDGKNTVQPYLATMAKMGLYEEVLNSQLIIAEENREVVKSRIKFLSFYADNADTLYDAALGTYDLNLTAVVADCLNKDPKEYLPILNSLRGLPHVKRCFSIDNSLKKWARGVKSLLEDASVQINEITKYIQRHQLFPYALDLLAGNSVSQARSPPEITSIQRAIQDSYGEYLETHDKLREASIFYKRAGNLPKAFDCLGKTGAWECALAVHEDEDPEQFKKLSRDLLHSLQQKQEWGSAARLCEVYLADYRLAVEFWVNAHKWTFAHALTVKDPTLRNMTTGLIKPKLLEHQVTLVDSLNNLLQEFRHRITRFRVIKAKREAMEDAGGAEGDNFSDTDSISTTSSMKSTTTSSNQTGRTYRSGKSKRKMERKLHSLKEGSRYEDLAIMIRVSDSATNLHVETKPDVATTVEYLWRFECDDNAIQLTSLLDVVIGVIDGIIKEIWSAPIVENTILDTKYRIPPIGWTSAWEKPSFLTINPDAI